MIQRCEDIETNMDDNCFNLNVEEEEYNAVQASGLVYNCESNIVKRGSRKDQLAIANMVIQ